MRAVILGCGPAGLAAAHAAVSSGYEAIVVSKDPEPSRQYGCQYLHAPVPGYEDVPNVRVSYRLTGTADQYRHKVYGASWAGKVSPEDFEGEHDAWDIRETYARLWDDLFAGARVRLIQREINRKGGMHPTILKADVIFSTIPAPALCYREEHIFRSHRIWANGTTEADASEAALGTNSIVCDGTWDHSWYRISNVFGYRTTEWSAPPGDHQAAAWPAVPVLKPLSNDCDCYPEVIRLGRYGTWAKSYLVHQVYTDVRDILGS